MGRYLLASGVRRETKRYALKSTRRGVACFDASGCKATLGSTSPTSLLTPHTYPRHGTRLRNAIDRCLVACTETMVDLVDGEGWISDESSFYGTSPPSSHSCSQLSSTQATNVLSGSWRRRRNANSTCYISSQSSVRSLRKKKTYLIPAYLRDPKMMFSAS